MRRTSFFGALTVIAIGGVFAFAIQSSPAWLDVHVAGMIMMVAGIADLAIRFILGDNPLLSQDAADVAAVVEPVGDPVLDVFGNPIRPAPVRVLQPPPPAYLTTLNPPTIANRWWSRASPRSARRSWMTEPGLDGRASEPGASSERRAEKGREKNVAYRGRGEAPGRLLLG